jgi:hypothetical protein
MNYRLCAATAVALAIGAGCSSNPDHATETSKEALEDPGCLKIKALIVNGKDWGPAVNYI